MTRRIRFHQAGGPEVLRFEEYDVPAPQAGEAVVRLHAIGLNRAEAAFRSGHYVEQAQLPAMPGYEGAGIVEAVGPAVGGIKRGDFVSIIPSFSMNRYGVYAERAVVPAASLLPVPEGLGAVEAAAIWMANLTAYGALVDICGLAEGETAVITAASSSVGLAAIAIARQVGAVPIAVTRSPDKAQALRQAGAAHVVVSGREPVAERVREIAGGNGARIAFDPVGGEMVAVLADALAPQGTLVLYGNLSGKMRETPIPFGAMAGKGLSLRGYLVFEVIHDSARFARAREFIQRGLQAGSLKPYIDRTFPFEEMVEAHRYLESGGQVGKIVVTVDEEG
ncbi:MAG TPA: zinc-dependent alcohol dehydrogenase family protein [Gammaproteobacteria bacterium]|nr:zinc-dependent alcohol dehydrogenase family protein [Gammaproteobacteria bacterium]